MQKVKLSKGIIMPVCTAERNTCKKGLYIAVDRTDNQRVVARGSNAQITIKKAEQTGKNFTIAYIPPPEKRYIF
jgi:hypothetical protein